MKNVEYLGDGAYVHMRDEDDSVVLTSGHHEPERAGNVIYLGNHEIEVLLEWLKRNGITGD